MRPSELSVDRPFPGLRPFGFSDRAFFFGRETQTAAVYRLLDRSRFIAVVGSSGSGKSSLVRAGLLSLVHEENQEAPDRGWCWFEMRPGDAPVTELAKALASSPMEEEHDATVHAARGERISFALERSSFGLAEALKIAGVQKRVLLIVDQFEELFRYGKPESGEARDLVQENRRREEAAHFVQLLLEGSRDSSLDISVLLTLRADFIGDCSRFQGLPEAVSAAQFLVPNLTREQRQEIICRPLTVAKANIEPVLIERLLNDSNDELDQLPVLQHCLMRLWDVAKPEDTTSPRTLTTAHYQAIGGIKQALSNHADAILEDIRDLEVAVEQVFRALSELDKDGRATRRALLLGRIVAESGIPEKQVYDVIDRFRKEDCSFLLPSPSMVETLSPETRIDVCHEALLRNWKRINSSQGPDFKEKKGWLWAEEKDGRTYRALLGLAETATSATEVTLPLDQVETRWQWWKERNRTEEWAARYGGGFQVVTRMLEASRAALQSYRRRKAFLATALAVLSLIVVFSGARELYNRQRDLKAKLKVTDDAAKGLVDEVANIKVEANTPAPEAVSSEVAKLYSTVEGPSATTPQEGYIWIGSKEQSYLLNPSGSEKVPPTDVKEGAEYKVSWNILLRRDFPSQLYRSAKSIGVVPEGTMVQVLTPTRSYQYRGKTQYWVKVRVLTK